MFKKKYVAVLLTAAFILFLPTSYANAKNDLELSANFDKNEYKTSDGISIQLLLKNAGKTPVYVNKRFFMNAEEASSENRDVYLIVESPSGEKLPCKVSYETGLPRTADFVLLAPGEEAKPERDKNIKYFFDFSKPGDYKVTAVYQNIRGQEIGVDTFKGKLTSKPSVIKVVE